MEEHDGSWFLKSQRLLDKYWQKCRNKEHMRYESYERVEKVQKKKKLYMRSDRLQLNCYFAPKRNLNIKATEGKIILACLAEYKIWCYWKYKPKYIS